MNDLHPIFNKDKTTVLYKWIKRTISSAESEKRLEKPGYYLLEDLKGKKVVCCKRPCFIEEEMNGLPEGLEYVTPEEEKNMFKGMGVENSKICNI